MHIVRLSKLHQTFSKLPSCYVVIALATMWFLIQAYYFITLGIKIVPDSTFRYIPYTKQVYTAGQLGASQENRYILYIGFLLLFIKAKVWLEAVVLAQIIISGFACILFYKAVSHLTSNNRSVATVATILFLLWKDIQHLNVYILTESLFTSLIIVVAFALIKSKHIVHYLLTLTISILPALLRPNGFIVAFGVIVCILFHYRHILLKYKRLLIGGIIIVFFSMIYVLDRYLLTTFEIVETYARGEVIYATDILSIPSKGVSLPDEKSSPILRILHFILINPIFFFKLLFLKALVFIVYAKPYYSLIHNTAIVLVIYPLYFWTVRLAVKCSNLPAKIFPIALFLSQTLIVAATSEDWDCRFIIPLIPVLMIFGIAGSYQFIKVS